jgi:hypothetical protein
MPSVRKKGKRMVGFYATEEEAAAMMQAAKAQNMTLADWLRALIPGESSSPPTRSKSSDAGKGTKKKPSA